MTKTCVICKKQPIPGDYTRSFHKFPLNNELKEKWMEAIGIHEIKKVSTICSDHFGDDSYHQTDGFTKTRRLLSTAVPVLYRNNSVLKQITKTIVIPSSKEETAHKTCLKDIDEYSLSNSLDSSSNINTVVSDFSIQVNTSSCIDESDVPQDLVTGTVCDTNLSFPQPKGTETITSDSKSINSKRKPSITGKSAIQKKKFYTSMVVPHLFICQKQNMPKAVVRMEAVKRQRLSCFNETLAEYAIKSGNILENGEPPEIIDDKVRAVPVAGPSSRSETCHNVVRPNTTLVMMPQVVLSKTSNSRSLLVGHHLNEQVGEPSRCLMTSQREKTERNICLPEAKEIITNVYHYLQTEYEYLKSYVSSDCDLTPLGNILMRTAEATGVNEQTVTALLDEGSHPLESTHKTVQRKHSNSSHYTSCEDDNVSDEHYTSRVETLQVEFEEDEDQRTDVNDKMWVKVEATPSESTFASRSLLSRPHHVKVEPLDFEYEHKLPFTTTPLRKRRQTNIGRKTRNATRVANIRRRERQSRIWQLQPEGLVTNPFIYSAPPPEHLEIKQEPSDIGYCQTSSTVHLAPLSEHVDIKEEPNDTEYCQSISAEPRVPPDAVHYPVKTEPSE